MMWKCGQFCQVNANGFFSENCGYRLLAIKDLMFTLELDTPS